MNEVTRLVCEQCGGTDGVARTPTGGGSGWGNFCSVCRGQPGVKPRVAGEVIPEGDPYAGFTVISAYTRRQAIEDGVLVDLDTAGIGWLRESEGIKIPVAITTNLWTAVIGEIKEATDGVVDPDWQPLPREELAKLPWFIRLKTLLMQFVGRCRRAGASQSRVEFEFPERDSSTRKVTVIGDVGPGDHGEPVITLMLPMDD